MIAFDVVVVTVSYMLPWALIGAHLVFEYNSLLISAVFLCMLLCKIVYGLMGMYDSLWRYAEIVEFFRLCVASAVAVSIFVVVTLLLWWGRTAGATVRLCAQRTVCIVADFVLAPDVPHVPEHNAEKSGLGPTAARCSSA